ncbi:MAG: T9SS type A sorting domain-containing protein [Ignavibacteria bacterium]|nr:T9SS type A sorting domain-containing protein [Ignavibacteria bacterium]
MSGNDVSKVSMTFKQPFDLSYLGVAKIFYGGYIQNRLEMVSAENSLTGDIYRQLSEEDKNYAEMDSTSFIILKFKNSDRKIPEGWTRNYVLTVKGRSVEPEGYKQYGISEENFSNPDLDNSPDKFLLHQNFPNPFNPITVINYTLAVSINVNLIIYDLLGKQVAEPVNEIQKEGNYTITFDGSNLPSGVYYYKITAGDFIQIRKMILIK